METTLVRYRTPCPVRRFPKPAHPVARKARKPSLQTMCPQRTSDAELTKSYSYKFKCQSNRPNDVAVCVATDS